MALLSLALEFNTTSSAFAIPSTLAATSRVNLAFLELSSPLLYTDINRIGFQKLASLFYTRVSIPFLSFWCPLRPASPEGPPLLLSLPPLLCPASRRTGPINPTSRPSSSSTGSRRCVPPRPSNFDLLNRLLNKQDRKRQDPGLRTLSHPLSSPTTSAQGSTTGDV